MTNSDPTQDSNTTVNFGVSLIFLISSVLFMVYARSVILPELTYIINTAPGFTFPVILIAGAARIMTRIMPVLLFGIFLITNPLTRRFLERVPSAVESAATSNLGWWLPSLPTPLPDKEANNSSSGWIEREYPPTAFGFQKRTWTIDKSGSGKNYHDKCLNCGNYTYHGVENHYAREFVISGVPIWRDSDASGWTTECQKCHEADLATYISRADSNEPWNQDQVRPPTDNPDQEVTPDKSKNTDQETNHN
ncbi:hypothetical protein RYH80_18365 [Halobaculum sp. MBLA0147]|uniref:hypothetical protein n=1 Tax=Halobaculum sp. MBLA0147 TaxID=3079934 RepID=UPI0035237F87